MVLLHVIEELKHCNGFERPQVYIEQVHLASWPPARPLLDALPHACAAKAWQWKPAGREQGASRCRYWSPNRPCPRCDLVVLGTHGRRGVDRLLMGSDAEQVARIAPVPVMLVRQPQSAAVTSQPGGWALQRDGSQPKHFVQRLGAAAVPVAVAEHRVRKCLCAGTVPARATTRCARPERSICGSTTTCSEALVRTGVPQWVSRQLGLSNLIDYIDDPCLPRLVRGLNRFLEVLQPEGFDEQNMTIGFGQMMYTPTDKTRSDLIADDRPFAGALMLSFGYNARLEDTLRTLADSRWRGRPSSWPDKHRTGGTTSLE